MEEEKPVSYGIGIEGIWRTFDPEKTYIKPNIIYQYDFEVEKKPWYLFWTWWADFDINKFTTKFKEDIADKLGTKPENIELIYVYFDNRTGEVRIQWKWNETEVGVAFSVNLAIVAITAIALLLETYLLIKLVTPKGAKELLIEFTKLAKYLMYAIIGGGSIYALIKILNLVSKKEKKPKIAKKPKIVGVTK